MKNASGWSDFRRRLSGAVMGSIGGWLVLSTLVTAMSLINAETASAAAKPPLSVSFAPSSVTVASSNTVTFTFTASEQASNTLVLVVPVAASGTPWSPPQLSSASQPGFVTVTGNTCNTATPTGVSGTGPWTIRVLFRCSPGRSFSIIYGAGAAQAKAPSLAATYGFTTGLNTGQGFLPLTTQPTVNVTAGAATRLALTGLANATAGAQQTATLTLRDAYNNVATGYRGTVALTSTDAQAALPAPVTFGAANAGTTTVGVTLKTAGSQTVTAADSTAPALTNTASIAITAAGIHGISVGYSPTLVGYQTPTLVAFPGDGGVFTSCGAAPYDAYGNTATFSGKFKWSATDPYAKMPGSAPTCVGTACSETVPVSPGIYLGCFFGTQGNQTVTASDPASGISGTIGIDVLGPRPTDDGYTFLNPSHSGTSVYTMNVVKNDKQTSGLTGNVFLGIFTNTVKTVTPPTYTDGATTYQVGVLKPNVDAHLLTWDLNPPAGATASIPGATLLRCPPAGNACVLSGPITAGYTLFDGVNESAPAALTLHLDTPPIPPLIVVEPSEFWNGGTTSSSGSTAVTVSPQGSGVPVPALQTNTGTLTPTSANMGTLVYSFNPSTSCAGCQGFQGVTATVEAPVNIPTGLVTSGSTAPITVNTSILPPVNAFIFDDPLKTTSKAYMTQDYVSFGTPDMTVELKNPEPKDPFNPYFVLSLAGPMITSCALGSVNIDCPAPTLDVRTDLSSLYVPPEDASLTVTAQLDGVFSHATGPITINLYRQPTSTLLEANLKAGSPCYPIYLYKSVFADPATDGPGVYSHTFTGFEYDYRYTWLASYPGDNNNMPVSLCGRPGNQIIVNGQPPKGAGYLEYGHLSDGTPYNSYNSK